MKCPYCHEENPPGNLKCSYCGKFLTGQDKTVGVPATYIPDYLVQSILVTLCCCLPFGIVAIVYAARVKAFLLSGQYTMAQEASDKAKMWSLVGFLIGIAISAIYILFIFLGGFADEL